MKHFCLIGRLRYQTLVEREGVIITKDEATYPACITFELTKDKSQAIM